MVARVLMLGAMAAALTHAQQLRNWANEDVAWIISAQDREQFNALQTDEQRTQFIDTFWARRDPTPGTPENEFRDEHHRRMRFANAQFRGWNTDRGLVYVRYGPPDERETEPGKGTLWPSEIWRYRFIEELGKEVTLAFSDAMHNPDLWLTWSVASYKVVNVPGARSEKLLAGRGITWTVLPPEVRQ